MDARSKRPPARGHIRGHNRGHALARAAFVALACCAVAAPAPAGAQGLDDIDEYKLQREQALFPGASASFLFRAARARNALQLDLHEESRAQYAALMQATDDRQSIRELAGLVIATYFDQGAHRDGLRYICRLYRGEPAWSVRYRHAVHAHVRVIAFKEGKEAAARVLGQLRSECPRPDFSPVWIGIELKHMRRLEQSETVYDNVSDRGRRAQFAILEEEDAAYLRNLVRTRPGDPFIDYAYYFLGEFDTVIERFPRSYIRDTVMLAAAQRAEGEAAIAYYNAYLRDYPQGPRVSTALFDLREVYIDSGLLAQAQQVSKVLQRVDLEGASGGFLTPASGQNYVADKLMCNKEEDAVKSLESGAFDRYLALMREINDALKGAGLEVPPEVVTRYQVVDRLRAETAGADMGRVFQTALKVRDVADSVKFEAIEKPDPYGLRDIHQDCGGACWCNGYSIYALSNAILWRVVDGAPGTELAERAHYIVGSNLRKRRQYEDSAAQLRAFIDRYPSSRLTDDAYAELVYYHARIEEDLDEARRVLDVLMDRFPDANATDNAANWMAIAHAERGEIVEAAKYYALILYWDISRRLRGIAEDRLDDVRAYKRVVAARPAVEGLRLAVVRPSPDWSWVEVAEVAPGSLAERLGFEVGDEVSAVNDIEIKSALQFYVALDKLPAGQGVTVALQRNYEDVQIRF